MAANKCSAASAAPMSVQGARDHAGQTMSLANAVAHLNAVSSGVSVEPSEYNWGTPSIMQQQALYTQFLQLAFMASLPQMQYPHLSACQSMQPGRGAMFPGFMPPFAGFLPSIAAPCPALSPSPAPCSNAGQAPQVIMANADNGVKVGKSGSPSKKSGSKASKASKGANTLSVAPSATAVAIGKDDPDIELEDICRLLGDDAFLEHLQDDVLSEGSNGSSSTSEDRMLSKNNSNNSVSGSLNNNDGGLLSGNNFASAFDMDLDDLPAPAPSHDTARTAAPAQMPPAKACSGDLNNMVASSPNKSTRSSRSAAREAAAAAAAAKESGSGPSGHLTKITLKTNKGGVQKTTSAKPAKAHAAAAVAADVASAAVVASVSISPAATASTPTAMPAEQHGQADCHLTAADLSRLLGEDDNRIPDGWDLDLDFENPFSCSISAF